MKEQFVTYEIALKLKELGFDEGCIASWWDGIFYIGITNTYEKKHYKVINAPLWQQVIDWFIDTHNYYIVVYRLNNKWCGDVYDILGQRYITSNALNNVLYDTYEEAREQAILKAIELCWKER